MFLLTASGVRLLTFYSNHQQDDDSQDTIGSNRSTPSGIATPKPDLSDKRQPSIMHSYFQVGLSSSDDNRPSNSWLPSSETLASTNGIQPGAHATDTRDGQGSGHNSSSAGSFVMMERDEASDMNASSGSPDKKFDTQEISPGSLPPTNLPTPPYSSACSLLQKESEEPELASSAPEKGMGSIFTALKSYLAPSTTTTASESQARRHTSHPVSSISDDPVLASHFSNPSLPASADSFSLTEGPLLDHEKPHLSMSSENLAKLTGNVSDLSRPKNTPPLTPRAMSNEGSEAAKNPPVTSSSSSSSSNTSSVQQQSDEMATSADEIAGNLNDAFPSPSETPKAEQQSGPSVGSLKGKLYVKITEARGLRPGFDPYVVCVFEWNEVISKSAQDEEEASIERREKEKEKSEREAGRPISIPMKSRQSSNNSAMEGHDFRGKSPVTDPHWNHEATLYVYSSGRLYYLLTRPVTFLEKSRRLMSRFMIATTRKRSLATYDCP
jgi:protein-serine/threonine kinase